MNDYTERREKQLADIPHELVPCKGELGAYYYGFDKTHCDEIDRILSGVAAAGCSSHNTNEWSDVGTARHDREADLISLVDVIQVHACRAAKLIESLREQNRILKEGIGSVRDLMEASNAVSGLHLNGDLANWESLEAGGHFESWLLAFNEAEELVAEELRESEG